MSSMDIFLSVLATVLGGTNIYQLFLLRAERRKSNAQAYQEEINALRTIIQSNVQEINRLNENYAELQDKYFNVAEELQKLKIEIHYGNKKQKDL